MLIIGLTGQTGAGKSTISAGFSEHGYFVIDADSTARSVTEKGSPVLKKLADRFGEDIINHDGELDRKKLAERAFATPEATDALNSITHPAITELIFGTVRDAQKKGYKAAVIDAAALFESGISDRCDIIVSVCAPDDVRLERIMLRDGLTKEQALTRMNAQKSTEYYTAKSDIIINNGNDRDINEVIREILIKTERLI